MARPTLDILRDVQSIEPLPAAALRILAIAELPEVVPAEVTDLVATDTGLTAKVLKLANSPLYGCTRQIASLQEAGTRLGTRALAALVLTSCAARRFRDAAGQDPVRAQQQWERAVSQAVAARLLASISGAVDPHRAYTAGLLQDLGASVLQRYFTSERDALQELLGGGATQLEAEHEAFGLTHAEVGARLAARWQLPEVLVDAIRCHHEPERSRCDALLASYVHLGGQLVQMLEENAGAAAERSYPLEEAALVHSGLDAIALASIEEGLVQELARARELLASA